jgi:voltage-gated potassium channel
MIREHKNHAVKRERWILLRSIIRLTEQPMVILSFTWLLLTIIDFSMGLSRPLVIANSIIWVIFGLDFFLQLLVAPHRLPYLQRNWITAISIALPAFKLLSFFRAFQVFRLFQAGRAINMLRLLTSLRRGIQALSRTLKRRGLGYIFGLSVLVTFAGAAGMLNFENPQSVADAGYSNTVNAGLHSYSEALWWTAMIMTTMGSEYWPKTSEGRILGFLIACYASVVYGYLTASIASHFIRTDESRKAASKRPISQEIQTG